MVMVVLVDVLAWVRGILVRVLKMLVRAQVPKTLVRAQEAWASSSFLVRRKAVVSRW
ncbi:MAG: hypothetical protein QM705_08885 [Ancrocorticia sp.]